jgi:hypothetical protein
MPEGTSAIGAAREAVQDCFGPGSAGHGGESSNTALSPDVPP